MQVNEDVLVADVHTEIPWWNASERPLISDANECFTISLIAQQGEALSSNNLMRKSQNYIDDPWNKHF